MPISELSIEVSLANGERETYNHFERRCVCMPQEEIMVHLIEGETVQSRSRNSFSVVYYI